MQIQSFWVQLTDLIEGLQKKKEKRIDSTEKKNQFDMQN